MDQAPIVDDCQMRRPGGDIVSAIDGHQQFDVAARQLLEDTVQFTTASVVESVIGIFHDQAGRATGQFPQEQQFSGLAGAELPVSEVKAGGHGKGMEQGVVGVEVGEKLADQGSGVGSIKEIAVVVADFFLKERLLSAK